MNDSQTNTSAEMKTPRMIYITETDKERLEPLIAAAPHTLSIEMLEEELARATIVSSHDIPADVVTMNSRVQFKDVTSGEESEVTLVYPGQADIERGKLSILAPVGAALLGLKVNDEVEWPLPSGRKRTLKILSVLFQPEAAGQYHL